MMGRETQLRRATFVLLAATLLAVAGCSSDEVDLGTVGGHVTKDGKPQSGVWLRFTPMQPGRPSSARTGADGKYDLKYTQQKPGALVGKHTVKLGIGGETGEGGAIKPETELRSEQVEVKAGANVLDFDISERSGGK